LGAAAEAAAECDDSPDHRVPIPPHRLPFNQLGNAVERYHRDSSEDNAVKVRAAFALHAAGADIGPITAEIDGCSARVLRAADLINAQWAGLLERE
jgi:hypothetical protein